MILTCVSSQSSPMILWEHLGARKCRAEGVKEPDFDKVARVLFASKHEKIVEIWVELSLESSTFFKNQQV